MEAANLQLEALKEFISSENKKLVTRLEEILEDVAKSGQYIFQWHFMKPLYTFKLEQVTKEFLEKNPPLLGDGTKDEEKIKELEGFQKMLLEIFDTFTSAPFTIQRLSELLKYPEKHYKSTAKFFRGLEKNILVVTTIDPVTVDQRKFLKRPSTDEGSESSGIKPKMKCTDNLKMENNDASEEGNQETSSLEEKNSVKKEEVTVKKEVVDNSEEEINETTVKQEAEDNTSIQESGLTNDTDKILLKKETVDHSQNEQDTEKVQKEEEEEETPMET